MMYYIIYLIGIILIIIRGIDISRLSYFIDISTLEIVLLPCLLMLFCTKSFKAFGECFLLTFGKKNDSALSCKRCLQSIKTVISTSVISGIISFMISFVNMLRSSSLASNAFELGFDISVASLSLFYALIICILLLPLHVMLKQHLMTLMDAEQSV